MLNEQLQSQIEQEAKASAADFNYFPYSTECEDLESSYITGATKYAEKLQAAEAKADRYEKALKEIMALPKPWNENPFSDLTIRIATEALTHKTSDDETVK